MLQGLSNCPRSRAYSTCAHTSTPYKCGHTFKPDRGSASFHYFISFRRGVLNCGVEIPCHKSPMKTISLVFGDFLVSLGRVLRDKLPPFGIKPEFFSRRC